ncbi:hypothetical protein ARMGADRAFT_1022994 [Armillaria gallica]|uniref:Uncharacterized protein n=1 Tax=Armillaria gallica TaxID=47427 RepID=A0A2H3EQA7_ARMGA|nr:hypothetical protein ARMGADRAFT_1022994 [Armillaria gallica]
MNNVPQEGFYEVSYGDDTDHKGLDTYYNAPSFRYAWFGEAIETGKATENQSHLHDSSYRMVKAYQNKVIDSIFLKLNKNGEVIQKGINVFQDEDYEVTGTYAELRISVHACIMLAELAPSGPAKVKPSVDKLIASLMDFAKPITAKQLFEANNKSILMDSATPESNGEDEDDDNPEHMFCVEDIQKVHDAEFNFSAAYQIILSQMWKELPDKEKEDLALKAKSKTVYRDENCKDFPYLLNNMLDRLASIDGPLGGGEFVVLYIVRNPGGSMAFQAGHLYAHANQSLDRHFHDTNLTNESIKSFHDVADVWSQWAGVTLMNGYQASKTILLPEIQTVFKLSMLMPRIALPMISLINFKHILRDVSISDVFFGQTFYWESIIKEPACYYDINKFVFPGGGLRSLFDMTVGELYGLAAYLKALESPFTFCVLLKSCRAPTSPDKSSGAIDNPAPENPVSTTPVNSCPTFAIITMSKSLWSNSRPASPIVTMPKPSRPTTPINSQPTTPVEEASNPSWATTPIASHLTMPVDESAEEDLADAPPLKNGHCKNIKKKPPLKKNVQNTIVGNSAGVQMRKRKSTNKVLPPAKRMR